MIKNIDHLRLRIKEYDNHSSTNYVCIGKGIDTLSTSEIQGALSHVYGIDIKHIYILDYDGTYSNGWVGSAYNEFYYITRNFYNENIMKTFTVQDAINKAQSLIGKTVSGTQSPFTAEAFSVFNTFSKPSWINEEGEDFIIEHGWVVVVENNDDFVVVSETLAEIKAVQLNDKYSAIIEGDYVHVGCQKIHKDKVIELANLLKLK